VIHTVLQDVLKYHNWTTTDIP